MLRIIIVVIAAAAGLGAGWLALQATARPAPEPELVRVSVPTVDVLAPAHDIRRGGRLTEGLLAWTPWPEDRLNPGMILRAREPDAPDELAGRVLRSNVYAGEPLRREHLARGDGGFLSMVLQPGTRAVGIKIANDKSAGGFILPNDRVDVLHTVIRDIDGDGNATGATRTILTNVRVLAIGLTSFDSDRLVGPDGEGREDGKAPPADGDEEGATITGKTATLEVTGRQAEVLLAAAASGQLTLALRAADDFGLSDVGDLSTIEGAPAAPVRATAPPPAAPGPVPAAAPPTTAATAARRIRIIASGNTRLVEPEIEANGKDGAS